MSTPTHAQLEADIAATREQLGETIESLGHKMDVKGRARDSAAAAAGRVTGQVKAQVRSRPAVPIGLVVAAVAVGAAVVLWRRRR